MGWFVPSLLGVLLLYNLYKSFIIYRNETDQRVGTHEEIHATVCQVNSVLTFRRSSLKAGHIIKEDKLILFFNKYRYLQKYVNVETCFHTVFTV
jgi:hypothetical protein